MFNITGLRGVLASKRQADNPKQSVTSTHKCAHLFIKDALISCSTCCCFSTVISFRISGITLLVSGRGVYTHIYLGTLTSRCDTALLCTCSPAEFLRLWLTFEFRTVNIHLDDIQVQNFQWKLWSKYCIFHHCGYLFSHHALTKCICLSLAPWKWETVV